MKILLLLFSLSLYANYAPKAQVEKCILLSVDKLVVPNEAAMTVSPSCLEAPCFAIPENFSCIYYKVVGDTLEVDATKRANFVNMSKEAQIIKDDFDFAQTMDSIANYCTYVYSSTCSALPAASKQKVRDGVLLKYGKIKPLILQKLGL